MIWKHPLSFSIGMILLGGGGLITIIIGCLWLLFRLSFRSGSSVSGPATDLVRAEDGTSNMMSGRDGPSESGESQTMAGTEQSTSPTGGRLGFGASSPSTLVQMLPLLRFSRCVIDGSLTWDLMGPMSECPVCLGEYEEGEMVRFLPNCKHIFHPECITAWIYEPSPLSSSCPLCRTDVKVEKLSQLESMLSRLSTPNPNSSEIEHWKVLGSCHGSSHASAETQPVNLCMSGDSNYECRFIHVGSALRPSIVAPVWGAYVLQANDVPPPIGHSFSSTKLLQPR